MKKDSNTVEIDNKVNSLTNILNDTIFTDEQNIVVLGAKENNLKNIDVVIPRNKLTVITGLSGCGKSSLAFNTLYVEGQRRYIDTFSTYAQQFIGNFERPNVERITGLSPVISIEQKTTVKNPRSTVGTITEIYDFLRLLYARIAEAYSYKSGQKMVKYTEDQIITLIQNDFINQQITILSPVIKGRKGHYKELFEQIRKKGFLYARIDGIITELKYGLTLDRYKNHTIEIIIDKLNISQQTDKQRLKQSVNTAMKHGKGIIMIVVNNETENVRYYSKHLMCPISGISYNEPAPHTFSFNSPHGACPHCNGLGTISEIDTKKIIPNPSISIANGGIIPLGKYRNTDIFWKIQAIAEKYKFKLTDAIKDIPEKALNAILYGSDEVFNIASTPLKNQANYLMNFDGIINYFFNKQHIDEDTSTNIRWYENFTKTITCPVCNGMRLKREALHFKIDGKNISEIAQLDIDDLYCWINQLHNKISDRQNVIAKEIIKELIKRVGFLLDVGLNYLTLDRTSKSLSGGENQRIRIATQIGSQLVNVLYILDEPSIGLHQRDNIKLINSLKQLRDTGNTIIVVEHDKETILSADYIIDMGPGAGEYGGQIVAEGPPEIIMKSETLTAQYLTNKKTIPVPKQRRKGNGKSIILYGARGNNLKNITVEFPLGKFICVTGVSGSGKSSLINQTLYPILNKHFNKSSLQPLEYEKIQHIDAIDKIIEINQSPLGRTPRSNAATYTGVFSDIRLLFEQTPEAKMRGYRSGRFSFNTKGGRCEACNGAGVKTIEMNFLPDVFVKCDVCNGKRYNRETLEIRYKNKSISEVLDMSIDQAIVFFENIPSILQKLKALQRVGLGYIRLGQASTTLSGGEAQRVKLAAELAKRDTGNTLYILDEPTTGLHFEDIRMLLEVLNMLVDKGNTVIVIEHTMEIIKVADYIIDLGPEGGKNGGYIVCCGSPEQIVKNKKSYTAKFLINYI